MMKTPNRKDSGADTHSKGNDLELDPNREPEPPVKVIDKPVQRTGKRNPGPEAPKPAAGQAPGTWKFWRVLRGMARMKWSRGRSGIEMRRAEETV